MPTRRRDFMAMIAGAALIAHRDDTAIGAQGPEPGKWRSQFPALNARIGDHRLVYLDNAATTHRPQAVLDAELAYYRQANANPSARMHTLARRSFERYEAARQQVASHINAYDSSELVFCRGATEAINLVASTWATEHVRAGDEILITVGEHYSNLLPWQDVVRRTGARLRFIEVDDAGQVRLDSLERMLSKRTRLVSLAQVSHVLGTIAPVQQVCELAHHFGAHVMVDGAQAAPHLAIDVRAIGCDFFVFSGHKMLGPMSTGALWARRATLDAMPPYQFGGHMASRVTPEKSEYASGAFKFEAGSPNVAGPVAWAAALEFMNTLGFERTRRYLQDLSAYCARRLTGITRVRLLGRATTNEHVGIFSFVVEGQDPAETAAALDARGIAVRSGDLAAAPLLRRLGRESAVRVSLYLYNDTDEVDLLVQVLEQCGGRLTPLHPRARFLRPSQAARR
jgi:cysteine desulfurase / selenocysteine lyase